jgi:hypothetical protein
VLGVLIGLNLRPRLRVQTTPIRSRHQEDGDRKSENSGLPFTARRKFGGRLDGFGFGVAVLALLFMKERGPLRE